MMYKISLNASNILAYKNKLFEKYKYSFSLSLSFFFFCFHDIFVENQLAR